MKQKRLQKTVKIVERVIQTRILKDAFIRFTWFHRHVAELDSISVRFRRQKDREAIARALAIWRECPDRRRYQKQTMDWATEWDATRNLKKVLAAFSKNEYYGKLQKKAWKCFVRSRKWDALCGLFIAAENNIKILEVARKVNKMRTCRSFFDYWFKQSQHSQDLRKYEEWLLEQRDSAIEINRTLEKESALSSSRVPHRPVPRISSPIWSFAADRMQNSKKLQEIQDAESHRIITSQIQVICHWQDNFRRHVERLNYLRKKVKRSAEKPAGGGSAQDALDQGEVEYLEDVCNRYLEGSALRKIQLEQLHHQLSLIENSSSIG